MSYLIVAPWYAAALGVLVIGLGYRITRVRRAEGVPIGDGGCRPLIRAVRAHGNALENIPIFLIFLMMLELNGASHWVLHALAAPFVLARFAHARALSRTSGASRGRFFGTAVSWLCLLLAIIINLAIVVLRTT